MIFSVSYNNNKMLLRWSGTGVALSPELKLLQYNILPLVLEETDTYTIEKNGVYHYNFKLSVNLWISLIL